MSDANKIICGQPIGTLVEKAIKTGKFNVNSRELVPIQDLKIGDYISSYHFTDSAVYARLLLGIDSYNYQGKIFSIELDGKETKCLPSHKCLIRYRDITQNYCVYVMKKGSAFRVGMSKIWHSANGCGPYKRLLDEDGEELWILKTFDNRRAALLEECKISIRFRLPQAMFKFKEGRGSWTQEEFDYVWSEVSNIDDAQRVIEHYGRDINFPYFNRSKKHTSMKRPHEVRACNLLDNSEMIVRGKKWVNVKHSIEDYDGIIYNLSVDKDENYYGNNILIHT